MRSSRNSMIELNSSIVALEFALRVAVAIGKKLKLPASRAYILFRVFDRLAYWSMKLLLAYAFTAPSSIPTAIVLTYFYACFLANEFLASNLYSTHLLKLMLVRV